MMRRHPALLLALLLLTSCGFSSVYGTRDKGQPVENRLSQVAIENIPDREGQILRNYLIDRMYGSAGRPNQPTHQLDVKINGSITDLGLRNNAISTRSRLDMYGEYVLRNNKGQVVVSGKARSTASFNKLSDQYASLAAKENAYQRTLEEVGEQIVNRVGLYFAEQSALPAVQK